MNEITAKLLQFGYGRSTTWHIHSKDDIESDGPLPANSIEKTVDVLCKLHQKGPTAAADEKHELLID